MTTTMAVRDFRLENKDFRNLCGCKKVLEAIFYFLFRLLRYKKHLDTLFFPTAVWVTVAIFLGGSPFSVQAQVAGKSGAPDLVVATKGASTATVVVVPKAGPWELQAARDLAHYIERMSGAKIALADTDAAAAKALAGTAPLLIVGQKALLLAPELRQALDKVAKKKPVLRADAIVLKRAGNRVYLAGLNDDCHYYAVAELLKRWGCRWYMPTAFGECVPRHATLKVGTLDYAYAPPFEVRRYWISWNGDTSGRKEFMHRNGMNDVSVPSGHILAKYTKDLIPKGKTMFNVPIAEDKTARHVAKQVAPLFAAGKDVQLGMEDGLYQSDSPLDKELTALQYDKYFMTPSATDAFLTFYNKVADILIKQYPQSKSKIGFLAYANMTLPPKRVTGARQPLLAYLAAIDIDPIHGMDDPRSAPRQEYKTMLYQWAKVMAGRVVIYDYDQSMLVWRDLPNPSQQAFRQDVKHYRKAGILGVDTESRNALATVFLNLYFRGELMWNPDVDTDKLLAEFYPNFYGPAAEPMARYWQAIFAAWQDTFVTEHEYFLAPALYTPQLVATLRKHLESAEAAVKPLAAKINKTLDEQRFLERVRFTRMSFDILDAYMAMTHAAASECDYRAAVAAGERGLAARDKMTDTNGLFTTYRRIGEHGYAWWPGEVKQYRELLPFVDGSKGQLIAKLPLVWSFRRDPRNQGEKAGWENQQPDLHWWKAQTKPKSLKSRQSNPGQWEQVRSDLYLQAQGLVTPDFQSYTGYGWYRVKMPFSEAQTGGAVHLRFPGLFNECWLYVNGKQVAHRPMKNIWWRNDYRFEWDVDLSGKLKAGVNSIVLRIHNPHHFGGMFRRPFLYRVKIVGAS